VEQRIGAQEAGGDRLEGYPRHGRRRHAFYIPIEPQYTYAQARSFAEILARMVASERPICSLRARGRSRGKRQSLFRLLQISSGKTISAPYVLRAFPVRRYPLRLSGQK